MHKFWSLLFGVVIFLCLAIFVVAAVVPGWWLPPNVSTFGGSVDSLFYLILWITAFFFVLTEAILIYNIYKFGAPDPNRKVPYIHGNHKLEVVWTIVPAGILLLIAILQIGTWAEIKYLKNFPKPDANTCQMVVMARQWEWRIRYPSPQEIRRWDKDSKGAESWAKMADYPYEDFPQYDDVHDVNAVHIWRVDDKGQNGRALVHLKTRDVLHSFFLPTLRLKQDAVPGKSIPVWFAATDYNCAQPPTGGKWVDGYNPKAGKFDDPGYIWDLACAEYCGVRHSMMKGRLYVHKDKEDFLKWLESAQAEQQQRTPSAPEKTTTAAAP